MKQEKWFPSCLIPLVSVGLVIFGIDVVNAAIVSGKAPVPVAQAVSGVGTANSTSSVKHVSPSCQVAGENVAQRREKIRDVRPTGPEPTTTEALNPESGAAAAEAGTTLPGKIIRKKMDEASFFNAQVHDIAVQLIKNFNGDSGPGSPVAVSTFVDLNNLHKTSPFGRYLAEQLMGELQRAGFRVIEVRKTDSILVKERYGEYGLSRNVGEISNEAAAQLVLVGTYITKGKYILINARIVSNKENMLVSSAMKILRRDHFLDRMLWPTMAPDTSPSVKIPIKEFGQPTEVKIISGS